MQPQLGEAAAPHLLPINADPKTITWERLETLRLKRLGLTNKYSRHFNVLRKSSEDHPAMAMSREATFHMPPAPQASQDPLAAVALRSHSAHPAGKSLEGKRKANSLAPFATLGKPTCGYFFSRETDNKKKKFGIPPSDLVKWRNFPSSSQ